MTAHLLHVTPAQDERDPWQRALNDDERREHEEFLDRLNAQDRHEWRRVRAKKRGATVLYRCWIGMRNRCLKASYSNYVDYGGRGVTICDEWRNDFGAFRRWALLNGFQKGKSIDRRDNNGGYSPQNCRWATMIEQGANTRRSVLLTLGGETLTIRGWARKLGWNKATIQYRLSAGWPVELALTLKRNNRNRPLG